MATKMIKPKWTYEDYLLFPDDGKRHELIDGEHYVTPSPNTKHQRLSVKLCTDLENFLRKTSLGMVFSAPCDVVLSDIDVVEPDLLFISTDRKDIITEKNIQGAPDLVVEILSDSTRKTDEITKRKLYEQHDIKEYWIFDPELETVKVYRKDNNTFQPPIHLSHEKRSSKPLLLEEIGYHSWAAAPEESRDEATQAKILGEVIHAADETNLAGWVIWTAFDFVAPPGQPSNYEHFFGLWRSDLTPKPALPALPLR